MTSIKSNDVSLVRWRGFEKTTEVHVNYKWCHKTGKFRGTNSVKTSSKGTDDVMIMRSCDIGKTAWRDVK